ncbi:MAG: fumarylacetoacetate hydrolase family protein [Candidatus Heimdallarchaeota archaeon]|nr:fumarylacetoacetate hydrolase family protein [Candidatus Heimdallarchaeota archaeon]
MKIICLARNYVAHARELNNPLPEKPLFFMKHENSIVRGNKPFYYPDFSSDIHHEVELVLKISKVGKNIEKKFAHRYYDEVGLGIDFTARDLQKEARENGAPWEIAKAFDNSAPLSDFLPVSDFKDVSSISFYLDINGKRVQEGVAKLMIFPIDVQIAYISRFITLKTGDLIFTGTPEGVGPIQIGDHFEAFIEDEKVLNLDIK